MKPSTILALAFAGFAFAVPYTADEIEPLKANLVARVAPPTEADISKFINDHPGMAMAGVDVRGYLREHPEAMGYPAITDKKRHLEKRLSHTCIACLVVCVFSHPRQQIRDDWGSVLVGCNLTCLFNGACTDAETHEWTTQHPTPNNLPDP